MITKMGPYKFLSGVITPEVGLYPRLPIYKAIYWGYNPTYN